MTGITPHDQATRDRIAHSLGENLFVEAGAGTGKTTALVARMVSLVVDEEVPVEEIVAITFTEKAAAELGDRFRRELEEVARHDVNQERRRLADLALADVDLAALTTLHGFARRLLTDHPLEAGLPPGFEVLNEVAGQLAFEDRWAELHHRLLADDGLERTILLADALRIRLSHLRDLAEKLDDQWDLLGDPDPDDAPAAPPDLDPTDIAKILGHLDQAVALDRDDIDDGDKLRVKLNRMRAARLALGRAADELEVIRVLADKDHRGSLGANVSNKDVWGSTKADIVAEAKDAALLWDGIVRATAEPVLRRLVDELVLATLEMANERRRAGNLTFHDLLVLARDLLADPDEGPSVRAALHGHYGRLLLDEFQDTDPLQLEIALLLADPTTSPDRGLDEFAPTPGSLFLVGDPKQSIYRFRRADISLYLEAQRSLPATLLALTENFRTTVPIVEWVNAVFGHLIETTGTTSHTDLVQPDYVPLVGRRPAATVGPAVTVLGRDPHGKEMKAPVLQRREAADVADAITTAVADHWQVEDEHGAWRDCGFADIAVLLPTKTSLPALETALEAAGIPYRAESSSMLFATPQIRNLLMVLRAVDDPTDDLAVVAALRTPYLGCGDDDLARWRVHHGGTWNHQTRQPVGDPSVAVVADGLAWLGAVHRLRHHLGPSGVLERLVRDRRVLQVAFGEARPRDAWRRVRLLADRARLFDEAGGGSLRGFVDWCLSLADDGSRVAETVLPEVDDDAVRILTIHGAKGLEFPITVLSGMSTKLPRADRDSQLLLDAHGGSEVRIREDIETTGFDGLHDVDRRFRDAESIRLLYVAATRARDHLVVSLHRAADAGTSDRAGPGRLLARAISQLDGPAGETARGADLVPTTGDLPDPPTPSRRSLPDRPTWLADRERAMDRAARPSTVSATAIATHAAGAPDEDRARPGEVGRHGTGVGRAVHGALEVLDFTTDDPSATVREQAIAEGLLGDLRTIDALVRAGLASDSVRAAADSRHWRELYVAAPVDDRPDAPVVEGYVDLAYLEEDPAGSPGDGRAGPGLVVVDYKTDAVADDAERAAKAARYRLQGATYALAAERATGLPVRRVVLCFLAVDGATDVEVDDLPAAMAEVAAVARELSGRSTGT